MGGYPGALRYERTPQGLAYSRESIVEAAIGILNWKKDHIYSGAEEFVPIVIAVFWSCDYKEFGQHERIFVGS
jgi:hypothetical protein